MWLEQCENFADFWRGYLPYYLLIVLPIFIVVSPVSPVIASHELPVYRMHQYDLHGLAHGCRSASIQLEAKSLNSWHTSRHCIITRMIDLTPDVFYNIRSKAGALIIMLPKDLKNLTEDEQQNISSMEFSMMSGGETAIPVYFSPWNSDLEEILDDLGHESSTDEKTLTGLQSLINSISGNGYQVIVNAGQPTPKNNIKVATIQGRLAGFSVDHKVPTIAIVAHYDSSSVVTDLSFGAESNASGMAMLLELARIFSSLYSESKSRPHYNMLFLLSGAGKLNYQGSKKWLEDQLDGVERSMIQDASYVICLEAVSKTDNLYLHVSKPPKDNSFGHLFYEELSSVANSTDNVNVEGVHKKINLADESLAWEHERYSIRRLPAATLSTLKKYNDEERLSMLDVIKDGEIDRLYKHTTIVAEALARHIYKLNSTQIFSPPVEVSKDSLSMWMKYSTSQSRSASSLADQHHPLVNSLQQIMSTYLMDVRTTFHAPDKRDPEYMFYDVTNAMMNVYSVKPAIFDLFLTLAIALYLGLLYLMVHNFSRIYDLAIRVSSTDEQVASK